jgi:hypothetical protein
MNSHSACVLGVKLDLQISRNGYNLLCIDLDINVGEYKAASGLSRAIKSLKNVWKRVCFEISSRSS